MQEVARTAIGEYVSGRPERLRAAIDRVRTRGRRASRPARPVTEAPFDYLTDADLLDIALGVSAT
jgi:hypothetical protein